MEGARGVCMNGVCSSSKNSGDSWKKGWPLQSGGFAILCNKCGSAYEELVFCETFHLEDSGWRECTSCGKRVHCGCIASSLLLQLLDTGGVNCTSCSTNASKLPHTLLQKAHQIKPKAFELTQRSEEDYSNTEEVPSRSIHPSYIGPFKNYGILQESTSTKSLLNGPLVQTNLSIGLSSTKNSSNPLYRVIGEEQGCRPHTLLPKLPNSVGGIEANSSRTVSPIRVARPPPVEGRIKNQLLPRYWPRITEQELQKISGDSNSIIVPLFEKILSASDAGRIGRLVLPKACAEAYFPPISQPEGISLRIQDVKGKEWVFQFRFWPNNNSRMYVLEGVTPCIQSMQLQAGDTVTFSRMDPEGKLLMGFRKATNNISGHQASINSGSFPAEKLHSASGIFQSLKGSSRNSSMPNLLSKHASTGNYTTPPNGSKNGDNQPFPTDNRKRSRNIGPKSKRLLMDDRDAIELKLSWDEVHDLLRPSPNVKPSTTDVEDQEFEEFEEPPVFGKTSIFIVRLSGEHEQWAQCDNCFKWRKLPTDFLLPHKWTCEDNNQDQLRISCAAPNELSPMELENLLRMNNELKSYKVGDSQKTTDNYEFQEGASTIATTTKHPRHRPGCTCIVCIQPPSGKGKHDPTCICNVCQTVKRRFKTLMMRKKKRQSEREAETAAQTTNGVDVHDIPNQVDNTRSENAESSSRKLDLNVCPGRESIMQSRVSMTSLVHEASLPLETYLRQNGLVSLVSDQSPTSPSVVAPEETMANTEDQELENEPP